MTFKRVIIPFLLVAAAAGSLTTTSVRAAYTVCRFDPVILLSNGKTVQLTAGVTDALSDIKGVSYVLHAPRGTAVISVTYSGALSATQEKFAFYADSAAGTYDGYTTVTTGTAKIPVSAFELVGAVHGVTENGYSGTAIKTHVVAP